MSGQQLHEEKFRAEYLEAQRAALAVYAINKHRLTQRLEESEARLDAALKLEGNIYQIDRAKEIFNEASQAVETLVHDEPTCSMAGWHESLWASDNLQGFLGDYPSMLRVGDLLGFPSYTPAMLPTPLSQNLLIGGPLATSVGITEGIIMRLLVSTPGLVVHVLDPENNGSSFARLGKADTTKGGVFAPVIKHSKDMMTELGHLAERVYTVSNNFLQGTVSDIYEYNQIAASPEAVHLVIAVNPELYPNEQFSSLQKLKRTGPACGIHTIELVEKQGTSKAQEKVYSFDHGEYNIVGRQIILPLRRMTYTPSEEPPSELLHKVIKWAEKQHSAGVKSLSLSELLPDAHVRPTGLVSAVIGKSGTNDFELELGVKGAHPHLLIAGQTGSGKSTLLHTLICSFASKYSHEDLNFYLVDAKQGVEMRGYAPLPTSPSYPAFMPHVKIAAVKSDIRTYISVLEKVQADIKERAKICSQFGVTDVVDLAAKPLAPRIPRIIVILDEFHVLLTDPQFGDKASKLLKDVAKQARAYGIHLVLATQSLGNLGSRGENAPLFEQLGNRIALACDVNVSEMILGGNNTAAAKLSRLGEAVFTASVGSISQNVPLQVAYMTPENRGELVTNIHTTAVLGAVVEDPFVFAGDSLTDITTSPLLTESAGTGSTRLWLGSPVRIAGPVKTVLKNMTAGNLLLFGVGEDDGSDVGGVMISAALSALKAHPDARFIVACPNEESPLEGPSRELAEFLSVVGANVKLVESGRTLMNEVASLEAEVKAAAAAGYDQEPDIKTFFIVPDGDATLAPESLKALASMGPAVGFHVMVAVGSKRSLSSVTGIGIFDKALNLFDSRIFAQVNAAEASASVLNLPERPANEEERFTLWDAARPNKVEVFVPYGVPTQAGWKSLQKAFESEI